MVREVVGLKDHNHITHQIGINFHNIVAVRRSSMIARKPFHLSGLMANCQSIQNKDLTVHEHLVSNNIDCRIFTETWLMDNLDDIVWCVTFPLQNCGFKSLHQIKTVEGAVAWP